jgi:hypothetical protein
MSTKRPSSGSNKTEKRVKFDDGNVPRPAPATIENRDDYEEEEDLEVGRFSFGVNAHS